MIEMSKECLADIHEIPLVPDGEALKCEVVNVEAMERKLCDHEIKGATQINLRLAVVEPKSSFNGKQHFFKIQIPNAVNKALGLGKVKAGGKGSSNEAILKEYNLLKGKAANELDTSPGYEWWNDRLDKTLKAFNLKKGNFDEQQLNGKIVIAVFEQSDYNGKPQSQIGELRNVNSMGGEEGLM